MHYNILTNYNIKFLVHNEFIPLRNINIVDVFILELIFHDLLGVFWNLFLVY